MEPMPEVELSVRDRMPDYLATFIIGLAASTAVGLLIFFIWDPAIGNAIGYTIAMYGVVLLAAGGSSGGGVAAVAARMLPIAIGSDTAASIRVPAAYTGLYGLRPSTGRYDNSGVAPLAPTLDTIGPLTRSVDDLALIDSVLSDDFSSLIEIDLSSLRIGVPTEFFRAAWTRSNSSANSPTDSATLSFVLDQRFPPSVDSGGFLPPEPMYFCTRSICVQGT